MSSSTIPQLCFNCNKELGHTTYHIHGKRYCPDRVELMPKKAADKQRELIDQMATRIAEQTVEIMRLRSAIRNALNAYSKWQDTDIAHILSQALKDSEN